MVFFSSAFSDGHFHPHQPFVANTGIHLSALSALQFSELDLSQKDCFKYKQIPQRIKCS